MPDFVFMLGVSEFEPTSSWFRTKHATICATPFVGFMAFGDATFLCNLNKSTIRKAIAYGKLVNGVYVCKFGKQWIASMEAMKREYGEPIKHKLKVKIRPPLQS